MHSLKSADGLRLRSMSRPASYWWCACGRSKSQPFCDGSHKGTAFSPVEWKAEQAEQAWFCACKRTGNRPMCDGSHKKLVP